MRSESFWSPGDERALLRYRVGFGPLGEAAHAMLVGRDLERIFEFRREAIGDLIKR